ncbi:hypothetical protein ACU686_41255 [Yinghuangia aomiensis]
MSDTHLPGSVRPGFACTADDACVGGADGDPDAEASGGGGLVEPSYCPSPPPGVAPGGGRRGLGRDGVPRRGPDQEAAQEHREHRDRGLERHAAQPATRTWQPPMVERGFQVPSPAACPDGLSADGARRRRPP